MSGVFDGGQQQDIAMLFFQIQQPLDGGPARHRLAALRDNG